jgi:hypothetical protein
VEPGKGTVEPGKGFPSPAGAAQAHQEQYLRRALEAYHFFFPTVSMEGITRGTRAAGAKDNQAALMVLPQPRHRGFTLNSDTPYAGGVLDLQRSGPMVIELPPGPLVGLVDDHHHRWITDVGLPGKDAGKGGRHLIVPPGWDQSLPPDGFLTAHSGTWLTMAALRALPLNGDLKVATALLTSVRIYPLKDSGNRDGYGFVDGNASPADTTCLLWEDNLDFWRVLHDVIDAEAAIEEMRPLLGTLAEIGIEAGLPFAPDEDTARLLTSVARQGRDEMMVSAFASRRPDRIVWPDRTWEWAGLRPENGCFEREGSLDVEARDRWPEQPAGAAGRWIQTVPGRGWFCYFRIYGPQQAAFDGSWRPADLTAQR